MKTPLPRFALSIALVLVLGACGGQSNTRKNDEALGLDPQDSPAELYVKMAEEYYNRGQTEIAFRRAQQAIEADAKYPRAHIWIAFLLEQLRQTNEASKHYARAVELAPKNSDILNAYASFLCRQRDYAEADAYFAKAIGNPVYRTPWIAKTNAGNCALEAGNLPKAEGYYRSALETNAAFGAPLVKLAEIAMKRGDAKAASDSIERYFKPETVRTPGVSLAALKIGAEAERKLGNRKRAAYYEQQMKANFPEAPRNRAP